MRVSAVHCDDGIEENLKGRQFAARAMRCDGAGEVSAGAEAHHADAMGIYPQLLGVVAKILEGSATVVQRHLGIAVRKIVGQYAYCETEVKQRDLWLRLPNNYE